MVNLRPPPGDTWSFGKLVSVAQCPACGNKQRAGDAYRIRDYLGTGTVDEWNVWRCLSCASLFLDPRPDDASLAMAYQSYYTHQSATPIAGGGMLSRLAWGIFNGYLKARFAWHREPSHAIGRFICATIPPLALKLDYFGRHLFAKTFPTRGLLVDVGCGNGEFLLQAVDMGWRVHGVEPDAQAVNACRAQGLEVSLGTIDSVPSEMLGKADAVTLSHCIEHVVDPGALLRGVHGLLKPGAWVWIATPNPEGVGIRIFGNAWRGLEPSRHLCVPSQGQLRKLLADNGFEEIHLRRRGAHGKTITRESAQVAGLEASKNAGSWSVRSWLALPVRLAASIAGTLSARWGEETVIVARRRPAKAPV